MAVHKTHYSYSETLAVHQAHAFMYILYMAGDSRGNFCDWLKNRESFSPSKVLPYTVLQNDKSNMVVLMLVMCMWLPYFYG